MSDVGIGSKLVRSGSRFSSGVSLEGFLRLVPPFERKQLERIFSPELLALKELLSPAIEDFAQCQSVFREKGFVAGEPYRALLQEESGGVGVECQSRLKGSDPNQASLADLVELYVDRMLQFLPEHPTPRTTYWDCLGNAVFKYRRSDLDNALAAAWAAFAAEANSYPETAFRGLTRESIVAAVLKDSLAKAGFDSFRVSKASLRKWHPRPTWVDAAVGALRHDMFDVVLTAETFRPRKYALLPNFACEPAKRDTTFDSIDISFWLVPNRKIIEFDSAVLCVKYPLFWHYRNFYSMKGLQRVVDAHVVSVNTLINRQFSW